MPFKFGGGGDSYLPQPGSTQGTEIAKVIDGFTEIIFTGSKSNVGKYGFQCFQMLSCGRVDNDGLMMTGTLDFATP